MDNNKSKKQLMDKISKCKFVLNDLNLFLDTHPANKQALSMYAKYQEACDDLVDEYEKRYGPLTPGMTNNSEKWNWIDGPWPWERETGDTMNNL